MNTNQLNYETIVLQYKDLLWKYYQSMNSTFLSVSFLQCIVTYFFKNVSIYFPKEDFPKETMKDYFESENDYINHNFLTLSRQIRTDYSEHSFSFLLFAIEKRLKDLRADKKFEETLYQLRKSIYYIHQNMDQVKKNSSYRIYPRQSLHH